MSFFIKLAPEPIQDAVKKPSGEAYGEYLATVVLCGVCHTPVDDKHRPIESKEFAGGQTFVGPFGKVTSANITPHATGLGDKTVDNFIGLFRAHVGEAATVSGNNTLMMWRDYASMADEDLSAIYAYLSTVPAVDNAVEKWAQ